MQDKTTHKYIVWATNNYIHLGDGYYPSQEMVPELIIGKYTNIIQPRILKKQDEQAQRTRDKAEVFTPLWICNKQNNLVDEAWFGRNYIFNKSEGKTWTSNPDKIIFPNGKKWQDYVDARRLELSCGEAPYLASRYDPVTGEQIEIENRIGILDRKLRIVNENVDNTKDWIKWVERAFQSSYGYEYQGDNILLARENLLLTFIDYYQARFEKNPSLLETKKIANIIAWNIWQMDGITMTAPYSEALPKYQQLSMFDIIEETKSQSLEAVSCKIYDWRAQRSIEFKSMVKGG